MLELSFSFTDCAQIPQSSELVIPAPEAVEAAVITVEETESTAYTVVASAVRRFRGWITVAVRMTRTLIARIHAFVRAFLPLTGTDVLLQSSILNI